LKRMFAAALAAALLQSCIHPVREDPPPPIDIPDAFGEGGGKAENNHSAEAGRKAEEGRWWEAFGDPELDRLVEAALGGNLQMFSAWARIDQAMAVVTRSQAAWFPNLSANADYSYNQSVFFAGNLGKIKQKTGNYNLGVGASYEIDIWGKVKSMVDASKLDAQASRQDLDSLAMTLAAQVAEAWFGIIEMEAQKDLLQRQKKVNDTYLDLVESRFGQGLATALDVYQQRQQVASIKARLPNIESGLRVLRHQLAVLLGRPPSEDVAGESIELPQPPPLPRTGLPADVIGQRPDIRAAQMRVVAADHRIGVAIKDMLPSFSLNASTGFTSQGITDLFNNWIFGLGAGLVAPLLDGGRRLAEVDRVTAVRQELIGAYGQVVLSALKEVEDALVQERKQMEYLRDVRTQVEVARSALAAARERYVNGLIDYLPVLTALQALQTLEQSELTAHRQALSYRIQLCRAIGGTWTDALEHPKRPDKEEPR